MSRPASKPGVPRGQLFFARLMRATSGFWERLGRLESRILADDLRGVVVEAPIYVTGLARAGTTIVTEVLAAHPDVTSHRYSDFPPVWTPYWWNALRSRLPLPRPAPSERAHRDRIKVTPDSPEAVEEVLWMHFFPNAHRPGTDHVLDATVDNPRFESFYRDHLRKLLAVRGRTRYLAKGNYNITRLEYLLRMFPDARIIVPVRDPVWHIASLMKQDQLFCEQHRLEPKVTAYLKLLGHFEFGIHKHAINPRQNATVRDIERRWREGDEIGAWARYWALLHGHLLERLEASPALAEACLVVPYGSLCLDSGAWIDRLLAHCRLATEPFSSARKVFIEQLSPPDYYHPEFDHQTLERIRGLTGPAWHRLVGNHASVMERFGP